MMVGKLAEKMVELWVVLMVGSWVVTRAALKAEWKAVKRAASLVEKTVVMKADQTAGKMAGL